MDFDIIIYRITACICIVADTCAHASHIIYHTYIQTAYQCGINLIWLQKVRCICDLWPSTVYSNAEIWDLCLHPLYNDWNFICGANNIEKKIYFKYLTEIYL